MAAFAFVWACSKPVPSHSVDAQASPAKRALARHAPGHQAPRDPCAEALRRGEATVVDGQGRPVAPPRPASPVDSPQTTPNGDVGDAGIEQDPLGNGTGGTVPPPKLWLLAPSGGSKTAPNRVQLQVLHHDGGGCLEVFAEGRLRGRLPTSTGAWVKRWPQGRIRGFRQIDRWRLPASEPAPARRPADPTRTNASDSRLDSGLISNGAPRAAAISPGSDYAVYEVSLDDGERRLELRAVGRGTVRLLGLSSVLGRPGVVLHNVAVIGAQVANTLPGQATLVDHQLQRLDPTLVAVMLGTNDAYDDRLTPEQHEKRWTSLIRRLRGSGTRADCLVLGAPDFGDAHFRKARDLRRRAAQIRAVQRRVAATERCAFWDVYAAMGGQGAISRLVRAHPPFAYRDLVHLTASGYRALGLLLHEALMQRYAAYLASRPHLRIAPPDPGSGRTPEELQREREARRRWPTGLGAVALDDQGGKALGRFFRTLVLLTRKAPRAEARVLFVGDSHVAGDLLTGELRRRLARDFGDAGHGYLHAGAPWPGYSRQGLRTGATGSWQYYYLRTRNQAEQPRDTLFGLGGVSTWISIP